MNERKKRVRRLFFRVLIQNNSEKQKKATSELNEYQNKFNRMEINEIICFMKT